MRSRVSVIIPAYNAEAFVVETIESALAQTRPADEIIAVDDGSTDRTLDVLRRFEPSIVVLTKPNGGPASARNTAIRRAAGEYLAFLDCDDLWAPEKLEKQVAYLDRHPQVGLLFSEAIMFSEEAGRKVEMSPIGYTADPTFRQLLYGDFIPNSTVVIRRSCVEKVGLLNESRELIGVEDYEYWMRIARFFEMAGMPEPLAMYRIREGNLMGEGGDIEKGLVLSMRALREIERQFPGMWSETGVDRNLLFARLFIRAGFAWKQKGEWSECLRKYAGALRISLRPRVFRWIIAATLLRRWS
ncbi:MAG: glycosyltransferase [Acidobacteriota bacterium]|nr:MAG: glycosyltransferase [Acidobacteriota bacterium]